MLPFFLDVALLLHAMQLRTKAQDLTLGIDQFAYLLLAPFGATALIHLYRLCAHTPVRAETSATVWPRSTICRTASRLNSRVNRCVLMGPSYARIIGRKCLYLLWEVQDATAR